MNTTTIKTLPIDKITIPEHRQRSTARDVSELAASIAAAGLTNPITVDQDHVLVAGLHRLRACQSLGWQTIPARVQRFETPADRDLVEIDENLVRHDLTVLERAEHLHRKVEILREKGLLAPAHRPKKGAAAAPFQVTMEDMAAELGMSKRTLQEYLRIGRGIEPDLRRALHTTKLADERRWLLKAAGMISDLQGIGCTFINAAGRFEAAGVESPMILWALEHLVPIMLPPEPYGEILISADPVKWTGMSRAERPHRLVDIYPGKPFDIAPEIPACWIHVSGLDASFGTSGPVWRMFAHAILKHHVGVGLDDFSWNVAACKPLLDPWHGGPADDLWSTQDADEACGLTDERDDVVANGLEHAPQLWEDLFFWAGMDGPVGAWPDLSGLSPEQRKMPVTVE